jgi:hypothetical protein
VTQNYPPKSFWWPRPLWDSIGKRHTKCFAFADICRPKGTSRTKKVSKRFIQPCNLAEEEELVKLTFPLSVVGIKPNYRGGAVVKFACGVDWSQNSPRHARRHHPITGPRILQCNIHKSALVKGRISSVVYFQTQCIPISVTWLLWFASNGDLTRISRGLVKISRFCVMIPQYSIIRQSERIVGTA